MLTLESCAAALDRFLVDEKTLLRDRRGTKSNPLLLVVPADILERFRLSNGDLVILGPAPGDLFSRCARVFSDDYLPLPQEAPC